MKRILASMAGLVILLVMVGCDDAAMSLNRSDTVPAMMDRGIVYILPGIQGVDYHYKNIRQGLRGSGIKCAIKIHPWGCQIPGLNLLVNETDVAGDRGWGKKIALEIVEYQRNFPGRPVGIIGQSGGCGVAVFAAEALSRIPGAQPIEGLILLDASVSADYNLTAALSMCNRGILNFYNEQDVALLGAGTEMFGNMDGGHGDSAGRTGFDRRFPRLYQVEVTKDMAEAFANPHFADTSSAFASQFISPWLIDKTWPAYGSGHHANK
ncbi:MAG: hypothetical protein DRP83_05315 [Planctomycetota bacterium]|nr:MAG: hypothetical protein DRP83_05315 [Planctomycetota bacterium]